MVLPYTPTINEFNSTEYLLSTFEFERQNIAGCCKQTFCVQFSSKAKHDQEKLSAELKSLLTKPSNVLPFYPSSQNSNLL